MKKETVKQVIDPNDKDAIIKQLQEKNLELEAEVEALKNCVPWFNKGKRNKQRKNNSCE